MKTIFIPAKLKDSLNSQKILDFSKNLPKEISIAYSIQYQDIALELKNILSKSHIVNNVTQVLGCSKINFSKKTQAILLISDGRFHAVSLAYETKLPVFVFDNNLLSEVSKEEISNLERRQKSAYLKFLSSKTIGVLVSTKPGQENLKSAIDFKKTFKDKNVYLFLADNIDIREFENFGITSWVNTACPRLDMAGEVINLNSIKNLLN